MIYLRTIMNKNLNKIMVLLENRAVQQNIEDLENDLFHIQLRRMGLWLTLFW